MQIYLPYLESILSVWKKLLFYLVIQWFHFYETILKE